VYADSLSSSVVDINAGIMKYILLYI